MNQLKTSIRTLLIVAGVCVGTAALAAPSSTTPSSSHSASPTMSSSTGMNSGSANVTSDADVTRNVKSRLAAMSDLQGSNINVSTMEGKVTLTGTVTSKDQEKAAKSAVQSIPGVKKVDDDLSVSKGSSSGGRH